ncbi:transcriptional regulator [Streptomyces sp. NPDC091377]|uniref:transcriptional regulator n=1 Tax=Streptomyces sp. NPDC091377 TaxID=3365995 RepID=UPI0037FD6288
MSAVATKPPLPSRSHPAPRAAAPAPRTAVPVVVSPMLTRLAAEHATGTLHRERGTLHLTDGQVTYAESPSAPRRPVTAPGDDRPLAEGAWELYRLEALYDAAYFALAPSSVPGRFRYGAPPPPEHGGPVPVGVLERSVVRRRALLHRIWPDARADTAPLTRAPAAPGPAGTAARSVTARQWAVLERVDGIRTAPEIARDLGRLAFHTLVDVRRLAAAGLVRPGPLRDDRAADPDITLLKRLRDALEAL